MTSRDFAFIQTAPDRVFAGWGPFEQSPMRRPGRPAFFITDFFLADPHPWRHPATWEELTFAELASRMPDQGAPGIEWEAPSLGEFAPLFESALAAMQRDDIKKIVPVLFERGRLTGRSDVWGYLLNRLSAIPPGMWAYGYSYQAQGLIGATPEMLFRSAARGYATMALAGTRPAARSAELLSDPKELREHRLVVDDIVRRLAPFGNIEFGPLGIVELPGIAHLATPIRFEEIGGERMSFSEMIRRLHPTAALGVSPRTDAGERWLREADRGVKRRTFGAPFGLEREDGSALVLVAIRNLQWHHDQIRVGSGAGLLAESRLEREFEELRQKREQVKALFGLAGADDLDAVGARADAQRLS
ncbi:MAG TPA: chorismate-binding protein [Thermoanaerobaculia bacterium]|nr:chorismate-binding protein [Thermoanaerobaculia bacterium]